MSDVFKGLYDAYVEHYRPGFADEERERVAFIHGAMAAFVMLGVDVDDIEIVSEDGEHRQPMGEATELALAPYRISG